MKNSVVIKLGGEVLENKPQLSKFIQALYSRTDLFNVVIVHGGGSVVDNALKQACLETHKVDGERYTPPEHIPTVVGALAGYSNLQFISVLKQAQVMCVGLSLSDFEGIPLVRAETAGAVGIPDWSCMQSCVQFKHHLMQLLADNVVPVISPVGVLSDGEIVNVNADYAAAAISSLLDAPLYLLSNVEGVLNNEDEVIPELKVEDFEHWINAPYISHGMKVKLKAAYHATSQTRRSTAIASWASVEPVIAAIQGVSIGTEIMI